MRLSPRGGPGWWPGALALAVAVAAVGCGGAGKGTVSGKVTYKGAPLQGAKVVVSASNNQNVVAETGQDGSYTAPDVPSGPAKVAVQTSYMKQISRAPSYKPPKDQKLPSGKERAGVDPELAKHYKKIPDKYESADSSGLTLDVKRGSNTFDIKID